MKGVLLLLVVLLLHYESSVVASSDVLVEGNAFHFMTGAHITNHPVKVLERDLVLTTDDKGDFHFYSPVGANVTFFINGGSFPHELEPMVTNTISVPAEGLSGKNKVFVQTPQKASFDLLEVLVPRHIRKADCCQIVVTVSALGKTALDDPQGEPGATVTIEPSFEGSDKPDYFGIFKKGPLAEKTNPIDNSRVTTSGDGGVLFANAPYGEYVVRAYKKGVIWGPPVIMKCSESVVLANAAPPWGPHVVSVTDEYYSAQEGASTDVDGNATLPTTAIWAIGASCCAALIAGVVVAIIVHRRRSFLRRDRHALEASGGGDVEMKTNGL